MPDIGSIFQSKTGWDQACIGALINSSAQIQGLVDGDGHLANVPNNTIWSPKVTLENNVWGVTYNICQQWCTPSNNVLMDFSFQTFSQCFTNYLLPWLALTAQLPYETGSPWSNFMSFCLAVGSPALVSHSLTITILHRYWIRHQFDGLYSKATRPNVKQRYQEYGRRVRCAEYLLQEAQQVPLRAAQGKGWLSSLIVAPKNQEWWEKVRKHLSRSKRSVTFSLIAQFASAIIAWIFTVITAFDSSLGDVATALQISAGSLWIWLIPVISGWIAVGTQYGSDTIEETLENDNAYRALPPQSGGRLSESEGQKGIVERSGLTPQLHRIQTSHAFDAPDSRHLNIPNWLGADVSGDERRKGPIYNYARIFTSWKLADLVHGSMEKTLDRIENGRSCKHQCQQPVQHPLDDRSFAPWVDIDREGNLSGDSLETADYCGLPSAQPIEAYPKWNDITGDVWKRLIAASAMALFIQWGTTGPSLLIAYLTPAEGLGCRSGGYLLYGILGTAVWLLLLGSMLLSHASMLFYQAVHIRNPSIDFRNEDYSNGNNSNGHIALGSISNGGIGNDPRTPRYVRTWWHALVCGLAVSTRYLAKVLAIFNAVWIIISTLFEYIGFYDNCWCKSDVLSLGDNGWLILFKGTSDFQAAASSAWGGGVAMSVVVCLISFAVFGLGSRKTREDSVM